MSADRLAVIDRIVRKGIEGGGYPGAAVMVGRSGFLVYDQPYGRTTWAASGRPVSTTSTIYDVASLTKVVATTTAAMILFDEGKLDLDAPVQRYLPEFRGARKNRVTVRHLLTHRSALPAGLALSRRQLSVTQARTRVLEAPLRPYCTPGECFEYSDIGMIVLGYAIEKISGERLDAFVAKRVLQPLGMTATMFKPPTRLRSSVAPTAHASPRGRALQGEVHDETAYALGGAVGHAGLFSTASDLALFAQMMLNRGTLGDTRIVADSTVELFTRVHRGNRTLGWETPAGVRGAGDYLSPSAYGHTGFTGTSLWIDPERQMFVVLLTNRVYAPRTQRSGDVIAYVRNDVTDAAALSITADPQVPVLPMPEAFRSDTARPLNRPRSAPSTAPDQVKIPRVTSTDTPGDANATNAAPAAASVSEDEARLALRRVKDPELNLNIVDLGLVYAIRTSGANVEADLSLTSPGCPSGPEILKAAEDELRAVEGVGEVAVNLVWSPPWTPERIEPRVRAYLGF